jgi:hypothetical protein
MLEKDQNAKMSRECEKAFTFGVHSKLYRQNAVCGDDFPLPILDLRTPTN